MNKILLSWFLGCMVTHNALCAVWTNTDRSCLTEQDRPYAHMCGSTATNCPSGYFIRWQHWHGSSFKETDGTRRWCCGGSATKSGTWVAGGSWLTYERVRHEITPKASCSYTRVKNICGDVVSDPKCNKPDTCTGGQTLRNDECVDECPSGQGYESKSSNTCIKCETTNTQGVDSNGQCIKCDAGSEIFTHGSSHPKCEKKTALKAIAATSMKKCIVCNVDMQTFRKCLDIVQSYVEDLNEKKVDYKPVLERCKIDEKDLMTRTPAQ